MGSMLTEGQHIYIDKQNEIWKQALVKLLDLVWAEQEKQEASVLFLRDFRDDDIEIRDFFMDQGFIKIETEESNIVNNVDKTDSNVFFEKKLDSKKRHYFRNDVLTNEALFTVSIENCNKEDVKSFYQLYENVKSRKLSINTFNLPFKYFEALCESKDCEIIKIKFIEDQRIVCVLICLKNEMIYNLSLIGLDYTLDDSLNVYKKALYHTIKRGLDIKAEKICLGLSASFAKHKLGAETIKQVAYIQMKDNYSMTLIESMKHNVS